jgi:hypothetical protein
MPRKRDVILGTVAAAALLGIGAGIGSAGSGGSSATPAPEIQPVPGPTVTVPGPTVTAQAAKPPGPAGTMNGDGVFVVGSDIPPGTYHTTGAIDGTGGNCYYALLGSTDTSNIIDNNNVTGPATITVGPGVKAVQTSGCLPWHRV